MIEITDLKNCCGCEACAAICPKHCIDMIVQEGFYYPYVNKDSCVDCHMCENVCPEINKIAQKENIKYGAAGYIKDKDARMNSTSGGAAYLFSKKVTSDGGAAVGVAFDEEFQTHFVIAEDDEQIKSLQGSKYPQSRVGNVYSEIKKMLADGRKVIFFGTPCQTFGLKNFLGQKYDNLIVIDIICYGVPSPAVWKNYLDERFAGEKISEVIFKSKIKGWKKWRVFVKTDKTEYSAEKLNDIYMSSYLLGYNVRPSCYSCKFKGSSRCSDITIADAWGIPESNEQLNDGTGLSSVIVNTEKGLSFWRSLKNEMKYEEYSADDLVNGNPAYSVSISENIFRKKFWSHISAGNTLATLKKYSAASFFGKICNKLSGIFSK